MATRRTLELNDHELKDSQSLEIRAKAAHGFPCVAGAKRTVAIKGEYSPAVRHCL